MILHDEKVNLVTDRQINHDCVQSYIIWEIIIRVTIVVATESLYKITTIAVSLIQIERNICDSIPLDL